MGIRRQLFDIIKSYVIRVTHILIINIVLNDLDGKHMYFALCPGHPSKRPSVAWKLGHTVFLFIKIENSNLVRQYGLRLYVWVQPSMVREAALAEGRRFPHFITFFLFIKMEG